MTIDINQFWSLLTESQLVDVTQTQTLFSQFSSNPSIPKTPESLANFLVNHKAITSYQSLILSAGHSGPFRYGNYTVTKRIETGIMSGQFLARHTKTGYPVLLQFVGGTDPSLLSIWQGIESVVEQISEIQHPNWVETFEAVALANHRFVVSQPPQGVTLQEKFPRKARMPWKKACALIAQATKGLEQLHRLRIVHNAVSPRTIWLEKNGLIRLRLNLLPDPDFDRPNPNDKVGECKFDYMAPEAIKGDQTDPAFGTPLSRDLYSIGCILYRVIAGRPPFLESDLERKKQLVLTAPPTDLNKYDVPPELDSLIKKLLAKKPEERPPSAAEVANLLGLFSGKADEINALSIPESQTRSAFRESLTHFLPPEAVTRHVVSVPEIAVQPGVSTDGSLLQSEERLAKIQAATDASQKRKQNKWKVPAAVTAGLIALSGLIGILAYTANTFVVKKTEKPVLGTVEPGERSEPKAPGSAADLASLPPKLRPTIFQQLIEDDDKSLWETPTNGPPIEFSYLPSAPKLLFVFRPAEISGSDEGQRVIQSLGPAFEERIAQFQDQCGLDLENIEQLIVSLHTNDQFEYEPYFIVTTRQPVELARLMQNWNQPVLRQLENQQEMLDSADGKTAYYLLYEHEQRGGKKAGDPAADGIQREEKTGNETVAEEPTDTKSIQRFAMGSKLLIEEVALSLGATVLSGSLGSLAEWTDRDRHINILFLRNSLFNDEGQKLMGLENRMLNREMSVMLPDEIRGGLVSFHLDSGCYLELILDNSVDLKAIDLKEQMSNELRRQRDQLMLFVARIPSSEYWDMVRIRYGGMLTNVFQNLRWEVEHGQVIANCWLPPMAAHNLIAATEHVIAFSAGTSNVAKPVAKGPQSLQELLEAKRDLNIANPPDLNVLMADLQTEITDDFGSLPFAFNIRLIGSDLEKEGITKNQRPSELVISQKTLAEILTLIMVAANPSKDISGSSDPNCKLVWVVADDPVNPGEKAILITTRAAAAEKSYELPPAFRSK